MRNEANTETSVNKMKSNNTFTATLFADEREGKNYYI